jgi:hypothetical protein
MGPKVGLDTVVKKKIPSRSRESNPPIIQSVARSCTTELSSLLIDY